MLKNKFIYNTLILILFYIIFSYKYANSSLVNDNLPEIENYIVNLLDKTFYILNDDLLTVDEKIVNSRILLESNLDLPYMAKFTLGRKILNLKENQVNEYINLYSKYLINNYSTMVNKYSGQKVKIDKVLKLNSAVFLVKTELIHNSSIKIDYLVHYIKYNNKYVPKIFDIVTENISLIRSQQNEFINIIDTQGFPILLKKINEKLN